MKHSRSLSFAPGLMLSLLAMTSLAQAQVTAVPSALNFQGRLATPSGNPVADGTYPVRFSLWDAASAGTEKWNKTVANVQVKNGTFAVTLDTFPAGTFNGNLWLEVKIGTDAALAPRTPLVSVPYAMKSDLALTVPDDSITTTKLANSASSLAKVSGDVLVSFGGKIGIGTSTPGFPLSFASNLGDKISLWGDPGNNFGLGIQPGLLQLHTNSAASDIALGHGTSEAMTETMRIKGTGHVGIGTSNPQAKLDVNGTARMTGFQMPTGAGAGKVLTSDATGNATWGQIGASGIANGSITAAQLATSFLNAGGDLTGTYPNPQLAAKFSSLVKASGGTLAVLESGEFVDQRQELQTGNSIQAVNIQSFTPAVTGTLTGIDIHVSADLAPSASATLEIRRVSDNTLLSSQSILVANRPGEAFQHFALTTPVNVSAGTQYSWTVIASAGQIKLTGSSNDPYPGGSSNVFNVDFMFRTYMAGQGRPAIRVGSDVLFSSDIRIAGSYPLEFGFDVSGKESSAGKIGYATFTPGTLDIVGAGTTGSNRKIKFWNEGGATFNGNVGIGATSSNAHLHVQSGVNDVAVFAGDLAPGGAAAFQSNLTTTGNYHLELKNNGNTVFYVDGNGRPFGTGGYVSLSDARYKRNVVPIENALDSILNLRGVTYEWDTEKWKERGLPTGKQIGFIAQEVEKILPELVSTDAKGYKMVSYSDAVPVLVEAVKTLNARSVMQNKQTTSDQAEIAALKAKNAELEARLERIEAALLRGQK